MKYIVTILPKLRKSAFKELKKIDESIKIEHLDFSLFLVETKEDKFLENLRGLKNKRIGFSIEKFKYNQIFGLYKPIKW